MASRWQNIYDHLKGLGYDTYAPNQKTGECKSNYVVIKDAGVVEETEVSSVRALYEILLYVPFGQYPNIEPALTELKKDMDGLFPMIRPTHVQTPAYPDDAVKGYMVSIQYKNIRKKERA